MTDTDLQQKRLIAAAIDFAIVFAIAMAIGIAEFAVGMVLGRSSLGAMGMVSRILGFLGSVIILAILLLRDVLAGDRSLGKKFQDIRVVSTSGGGIGAMESIQRNLIFAIGAIFGTLSATLGLLPCLGDFVRCLLLPLNILALVIGVVAAIVEIVKIFQDPQGIRFGDSFAGTKVIR